MLKLLGSGGPPPPPSSGGWRLLIYRQGRNKCITTPQCVKHSTSSSPQTQHLLPCCLVLQWHHHPPSTRLKGFLWSVSPCPDYTQSAVDSVFLLSLTCLLLSSHRCCPNSDAYYLLLGLHRQSTPRWSPSASLQSVLPIRLICLKFSSHCVLTQPIIRSVALLFPHRIKATSTQGVASATLLFIFLSCPLSLH